MAFCTFHGNEGGKIDKFDLSSCFAKTTELTSLCKSAKIPQYEILSITKKIIPLISTFLHSSSDTQFLCVYPCSHWPEKKSLFFLHPHKQPLQVIHHTGLASLYHSFCQFKLLWKYAKQNIIVCIYAQ